MAHCLGCFRRFRRFRHCSQLGDLLPPLLQSSGELLARLQGSRGGGGGAEWGGAAAAVVVVSLSPQSVAALAAALGLPAADCAARMVTALRQLGARWVGGWVVGGGCGGVWGGCPPAGNRGLSCGRLGPGVGVGVPPRRGAGGQPPCGHAAIACRLPPPATCRAVFDVAWARDVALLESAAEFMQRFAGSQRGREALAHAAAAAAAHGGGGGDGVGEPMEVDGAGSSSGGGSDAWQPWQQQQQRRRRRQQEEEQQAAGERVQQRRAGSSGGGGGGDGEGLPGSQPLPMLASACPGWVCYAEKTHGRQVAMAPLRGHAHGCAWGVLPAVGRPGC